MTSSPPAPISPICAIPSPAAAPAPWLSALPRRRTCSASPAACSDPARRRICASPSPMSLPSAWRRSRTASAARPASTDSEMGLRIAERWFEMRRVDDAITLLWEPHVVPLMRCNIWHVRGRDRDLLIDTGMGVASLREAAQDIFDRPLAAVATHTHIDHVGSLHEFGERIVHDAEAAALERASENFSMLREDHPVEFIASLER